ncbi:MAG TPA: zinc-binding dehydrogenase [Blastocatellia bacterium]|nr:zinc-binding dehydrogenase [Blastocatellia bacterium]
MKAIVLRELGGPEKLLYEDVPDPRPGAGEVVVRLKAAALNHRDQWIRHGLYAGIKLPIILGSDGAGVIHAVGEGVDSSLTGREVVVNPSLDWGDDERAQSKNYRILGLPEDGTYAEFIKVPAKNALPKPEHLSWEEAAAIPLAGLTAYRAITTRAQVKAGETVLVTGIGGGVATFALQISKALGAKVLVTSGSDEKLARAKALGADGGVNYKGDNWSKELVALNGGEGPDVVIDSAGGATLEKAVEIVKPAGRIVFFGATTGLAHHLDLRRIFFKQLSILGSTMGSDREFDAMLKLYTDQKLKPVVDQVFSLKETPAAHQRMEEGGQLGKIVLKID